MNESELRTERQLSERPASECRPGEPASGEHPSSEQAPFRPGRVIVRLTRALERSLIDLDLTISQYRVLAILDRRREAASILAEKLSVSRPSVTGVIDGLEARGLVIRCQDCGDRRRVDVCLTASGVELLRRADAAVEARLEQLAGYAGDEGAEALRSLASWDRALREARAARRGARTAGSGHGADADRRAGEAAASRPKQSVDDEGRGR